MNELALFAGSGGGILGGKLLGWNTIAAVEIEEYPREILLQRQRDGILKPFPIWDDITTFDGRPWKGLIDIISGGFPCQDISAAGKGAGIDGERSGLWGEMARVIDEVRPRFAFVENSPMLTIRGLGRVLGDLSEMGYNARWCVLGADDAGAPHRRKRIWILAYANNDRSHSGSFKRSPNKKRWEKQDGPITERSKILADSNTKRLQGASCGRIRGFFKSVESSQGSESRGRATTERGIQWWNTDPADIPNTRQLNKRGPQESKWSSDNIAGQDRIRTTKPELGRVADGLAHRVDRLKAIGNGQVPGVAAISFTILSEGLIN